MNTKMNGSDAVTSYLTMLSQGCNELVVVGEIGALLHGRHFTSLIGYVMISCRRRRFKGNL